MEKGLLKLLVNGASLSLLREGYFSDVHVQLSEELTDLLDKIQRYGDAKIAELTADKDEFNIKSDFEHFISDLDKYDLGAGEFVESLLNKNPDLTFMDALLQIKDKYL